MGPVGATRMPCPQCYESDASICPTATDSSRLCSGIATNAIGLRTNAGDYPSSLRNTMPPQVRDTEGRHLDTLLGHVATGIVEETLTAEEQGVADDMNTLVETNLHLAVSLASKRPNLRVEIERRMDTIATSASAVQTSRITHFFLRIDAQAKAVKDKQDGID